MSSDRSDIYDLAKLAKELEQRFSSTGIPIPEDLQTQIARLNQNITIFLQASQEDFNSKKREDSQKEMLNDIWKMFLNNVIYIIIEEHHANLDIYRINQINKIHERDIIVDDLREKMRLVHEMLKQWPHMVPPQIKDINLPDGYLKNEMLLAYCSCDCDFVCECVRNPAINLRIGFVEQPSLNPDARQLSIQEYIRTEYRDEHCYVGDCYSELNWGFKRFAENLQSYPSYNIFEDDPTFLSELVEKYGSKGYLDVFEMFPCSLSHYHPSQ